MMKLGISLCRGHARGPDGGRQEVRRRRDVRQKQSLELGPLKMKKRPQEPGKARKPILPWSRQTEPDPLEFLSDF